MSGMSTHFNWFLRTVMGGAIGSILPLCTNSALAQIIPDRTLPNNSSVKRDGNILNITGGTQAGRNLFHSFREFSVTTSGTAYFNNALEIQNIISRVTGSSISNINGLIRANGKANLFLLNPNGIIFGRNAALKIGGSFTATTANSLKFADGSVFTTNPIPTSALLTISVPIGLQLNHNQTGTIFNSGNLAVNEGQNLTLIGSNVTNNGQLSATGGQVTVAAIPQGEASIGETGAILSWQDFSSYGSDIGTAIISGKIDASNIKPGKTGGRVLIVGSRVGLLDSVVNVSGDALGGKVVVGGDQGRGIPLASATYISPTTTINADALTRGNGGQITVNSTQSTRAYGSLSARGGRLAGNGGLIETSGSHFLDVAGIHADASAANGQSGTWLLDPRNVTLAYTTSTGSFSNGNPNIFTPSGDDAVVNIPDILNQLDAGTNVTISTNGTGTQLGNITATGFAIATINTSPVSLTLQASNDITLQNFGITANNAPLNVVLQAGVGSGSGNVRLTNASFETKGGAFTVTSPSSVELEYLGISNNNGAVASAPITITAPSVSVKSTGIVSNTSGNGDGALISINANSLVLQPGVSINSNTSGNGTGGSISINANSLVLQPGSSIKTNTSGNGNGGGEININVVGSISLNGSGIISTSNSGQAGPINLTSGSLKISNGSSINNSTTGQGNAGAIAIRTGSFTIEDNSGVRSDTGIDRGVGQVRSIDNTGNGGSINIIADTVSSNNRVLISSETGGRGSAGDITLQANSLTLTNASSISTSTFEGARGNAGLVNVTAKSVVFSNDISNFISGDSSGLGSVNRGTGNPGQIVLNADSVVLQNGGGLSVSTTGEGNAGRLTLNANSLLLQNAGISSETSGRGNAGEINIKVNRAEFNTGGIFADTFGSGNAGIINFTTDSLLLQNNSPITSSTFGSGNGGEVKVTANSAELRNNSLIGSQTTGSGNAGNLNLQIDSALRVGDRSRISVSTPLFSGTSTQFGEAGAINVQAGSIFLDRGTIEGRASSGNGGSITLAPRNLLLLRNGSQISTTSGTGQIGSGNGGNITINTPSGVVAAVQSENSDITANVFKGRGGFINITAARIFGLQLSNQLTLFSDITAFSQLKPQLNIPQMYSSLEVVDLPTSIIDASSRLRDVSCGTLNGNEENKFIITGRGGLPQGPDEPLTSDVVWLDTRLPVVTAQHQYKRHAAKLKPKPIVIIPATGWVFNDKGEVTLISSVSNPTSVNTPTSCSAR